MRGNSPLFGGSNKGQYSFLRNKELENCKSDTDSRTSQLEEEKAKLFLLYFFNYMLLAERELTIDACAKARALDGANWQEEEARLNLLMEHFNSVLHSTEVTTEKKINSSASGARISNEKLFEFVALYKKLSESLMANPTKEIRLASIYHLLHKQSNGLLSAENICQVLVENPFIRDMMEASHLDTNELIAKSHIQPKEKRITDIEFAADFIPSLIHYQCYETLESLLKSHPDLVNSKVIVIPPDSDHMEVPLLSFACTLLDYKAVKLLIYYGASVDLVQKNKDDSALALTLLQAERNPSYARTILCDLLDAGVDPDFQYKHEDGEVSQSPAEICREKLEKSEGILRYCYQMVIDASELKNKSQFSLRR